MKSTVKGTAMTVVAVLLASIARADDGDARRGAEIYESRCGACHSLEVNRVGPKHRGVYGRRAGSVLGYAYSTALRDSRVVWTPANLDKWLADPNVFIPGSRMGFRLGSPEDRADVITYLKQNSLD